MTASTLASPRAFAVWFRDLHRWSVGSFVQTDWRWPAQTIKPLSAVLSRKVVDVDRASAQPVGLRLVTLHFDGEMEPRDASAGVGFKGRLFHADPGDVIYSKIDVRNGAIGIIPDDLGRVCVSSEYPVYTVNPQLADARFVKLLFRTAAFRRKINSMISGASGRKRVQPTDLEGVEVPLPPLPVQRKIVAAWEAARKDAAATAERIAQLERDIEARFLADLGIDPSPFIRRGKHFVLPWTQLERWGVEFNRWDWVLGDIFKGRHPLRPLEELAWVNPSRAPRLERSAKVSFVPMEAVDAESGEIVGAEERELAKVAQGFTAFQDGDVIWAKITPCMQNGKCALAKGLTNGVGYGSTEFHVVRSRDAEALIPEFLWAILRLRRLRKAAQRYFIGSAGQQRVPPEFLCNLPIPVIPSALQRQVVGRIAKRREEIARLKAAAKAAMEASKADVEAMILGTKPVE